MSQALTLENLHEIDGGAVAIAFKRCLEEILKDLRDRDDLKKARTITMKLAFTPEIEEGECEGIQTVVTIESSIPAKSTRKNVLTLSRDGLFFDPDKKRTTTLPGQQVFQEGGE